MNTKLYVSDMDGSLLDEDKNLPNNIDEMMEKLFAKNLELTIATGRSYVDIASYLSKWINHIGVIAENGNQVVYKGNQIYNVCLDETFVKEVHDSFLKIGKGIMIFCGEKGIYRIKNDPFTLVDEQEINKYYNEITFVDTIDLLNDKIMKITVCSIEGSEIALYPTLKGFQDKATVMLSAHEWLDITKTGECKGKALSILQDYLSIPKEETICFGDYLNDISMKDFVSRSYAMKNAHPSVIEAFDEVIGSNNEGAVCKKILELI